MEDMWIVLNSNSLIGKRKNRTTIQNGCPRELIWVCKSIQISTSVMTLFILIQVLQRGKINKKD